MIDKRLMYAQGQRVAKTLNGSRPGYAGPNEPNDGQGVGANTDSGNNEGASSDDYGFGVTGGAPPESTTETTTDNDSDFDPFGHSRFDVGSGYYGEPVTSDPDETTIDESTTTFAPIEQPTVFQQFVEGIKNTAKFAVKGYVATQTFGALGLSPKAIAIGNTALGFGKQTGLTKSGSISELGLNTLSSIGDVFSGNKNTNSLSGNTNSLSKNTNSFSGNINNSLSDNNQNNGGEGGNNDVLSNEYILLLQKMQLGNFTQEDQTRFNLLKTMLGK